MIFSIVTGTITYNVLNNNSKSSEIKTLKYNQVVEGEEKVNGTDYVTFDAFFLKDTDKDGNAESYRGSSIDMSRGEKLYLDFKVLGDVTLKNGTIEFVNDNVKLSGTVPKSTVVKNTVDMSKNDKIYLNNVSNGASSLLEVNVYIPSKLDIDKYSGTNKVIFKGTVVDNVTNEEKQIKKEINYDVDWYVTSVYMYYKDKSSYMDMDTLTARYTFRTITSTNAQLRDVTISGTVSSLLGEKPESVKITSSNGPVDFYYDSDSQVFIATKSNKKVDDIVYNAYDYIYSGSYYNYWIIEVKYPSIEKALYDTQINVSIDSYAYATNNPNVEYDDVKSNVVNEIIYYTIPNPDTDGNLIDYSDISVGKYSSSRRDWYIDNSILVSKYLGENVSENFTYPVNWGIRYQYTTADVGKVYIDDLYDSYKSDSDTKEYTTYKSIKITPQNEDTKAIDIKIIDTETNNIIYVYNSSNFEETFIFPKNVREIKLEASNHEKSTMYSYSINIIKEVDNDKMSSLINLAKFNTYTQLSSGYKIIDGRENSINDTIIHQKSAHIAPRVSATFMSLNSYDYEPTSMSEPKFNMSVDIKHYDIANYDETYYTTWTNGKYLLVFSENVIDVEIPNLNGITLEKVELGNKIGVRISYDNKETFKQFLTLNFKITINPKSITSTGYVNLYSYDETAYKYDYPRPDIYDINENGSVIDNIQFNSSSFRLNIPKELITGAYIKNYDSKGSTTISPLVADVELMDGRQEADMEIFMINNSLNPISDIVLIGKTGYAGNTYQIGEGDLGSEYTANIKSAINVPEGLEDYTHIYYSTKTEPTKDVSDPANNWVENPSDFSIIKTYMIVVDGSYNLPSGAELDFTYKISVPNKRENLDKVSYFNHGVYFNYNTVSGKYATTASGGKLGVRISRKYDLNITNLKIFSTTVIKGSSYKITDNYGNVYTATTNNLGKATINGLYANRKYVLEQYNSGNGYVTDNDYRTFSVDLDDDNNPTLNKIGTYKSISLDNGSTLNVTLENEMYYILKINVKDVDTNEKLESIPFEIKDINLENSMTYYSNKDGILTIYGLKVGETYNVYQRTSDEYVPVPAFKISLTRNMQTKEVVFGIDSKIEIKPYRYSNSYYHFTANTSGSGSSIYYFSNNIYSTGLETSDVFEIDLTNLLI